MKGTVVNTLQPFRYTDAQSGKVVDFDESYRDEEGTPFATAKSIGTLLGFSKPRVSIDNLVNRHEFIREYSTVIKLVTPSSEDGRGGGLQEVRVFSPIAVFLICMKANTAKAREIQLAIARFLDAWRRGEFSVSRIPSAARQLDSLAFIELIKTQTLPKIFDQARRSDETGEYARGFLDALGFPKKPKPPNPGHDVASCPYYRQACGWDD